MADSRDDGRVSSAYRELPGDGPSPALDAAIQAAARRAAGSRPGAVRRWQIPVSIAAVLALAIGISLHVDREKPIVVDGTPVSSGSAEYPVPQAAPEKEEPVAPATQAAATAAPAPQSVAPAAPPPASLAKEAPPATEAKRLAPEPARSEPPAPAVAPATPRPRARCRLCSRARAAPAPAAARAPMQSPSMNIAPAPTAAPPAAAGAVAPAEAKRAAPQPALRAKSELSRDATTQEKVMSQALETPERRLERIADLRAKGLHDEADRELAEFRRAYPGYRISEEWLRKVERR